MNPFIYIENKEHFHAQRAKGIGSSDIPVLAGLYKHWDKSPVTLWMEKTGRSEAFQGNDRTKWGNHLEPLVLREFLAKRGKDTTGQVMADHHMRNKPYGKNGIEILTSCQHPDYPFAVAHADMINTKGDYFINCNKCNTLNEIEPSMSAPCIGEDCQNIIESPAEAIPYIVEAKTSGFYAGKRREANDFGWDKDIKGEGGIPAAVYLQIQYQMFVYGIEATWAAVLIDTADYNEYGLIHANKNIQEKILAMVANFWECIQKDQPPKPLIFKDLSLLFPKNKKTTKIISGSQLDEVLLMKDEKKRRETIIKKNKDKIDKIKTAVGAIIGEDEVLGTPEGKTIGKLTRIDGRKTVSTSAANIKKFPDIYKSLEDNKLIKHGDDYSKLSF